MPEFTSHPDTCPCWVDLMSPDVDGAKRFYHGLFGWDADDRFDDHGNRTYVMFSIEGRAIAGLGGPMAGDHDQPAFWNTYVGCHDLDAATERAVEAGGSVKVPPVEVPEAGAMAIVSDPNGAVISMWCPGRHIGAEICNEPNTWTWTELVTRDIDGARSFYRAVFDWEITGQDMGPFGTYWVASDGERDSWAGLMSMPAETPADEPDRWVTYFATDDIEATSARAVTLGGSIVVEPYDIPGVGRISAVSDPSGGVFGVLEPSEPD